MAVSESSSYVAYLRDVAQTTNACLTPAGSNVVARTQSRRTRHRHHQAEEDYSRGLSSNIKRHPSKRIAKSSLIDDDAYALESSREDYSYAYDYLREPPSGALSGGHKLCTGSTRDAVARRGSSVGAMRTKEATATSATTKTPTTSASATKATLARREEAAKDPLKATFEQMYATLKEIGCKEMEAAAAHRRTTHQRCPASPSCAPHTQLSSRGHTHTHSQPRASSPHATACFQHSWTGSALSVRVPPMLTEPEEKQKRNAALQRQPVNCGDASSNTTISKSIHKTLATSTDTSAVTSSSTKLTSSSDSSTSSDAVAHPGYHAPKRGTPQRRSSPSPPKYAAGRPSTSGYDCPYCCRRCDSCQCVGRPCQRSPQSSHLHRHRDSSSSPRRRQGRPLSPVGGKGDVAGQLVPEKLSGRSLTAITAQNAVPLRTISPLSAKSDAVRLTWPNQPETHNSRTSALTPPSRRASPVCSRRHHSNGAGSGRKAHSRQRFRRSSSSSPTAEPHRDAAKQKRKEERAAKEAVLREVAQRACTCYWSDFPDLKMAINPSSHAAACPYQAQHALYDELMSSFVEDSDDDDTGDDKNSKRKKDRSVALSSIHSRSSSASSYSVEERNVHTKQSMLRSAQRKDARGEVQRKPAATAPRSSGNSATTPIIGAAVREAVGKALTHEEEMLELHAQRRRWLAEEAEAAKKKKAQGRAAVMGSTQRRTYMEQLMSAARDTPSPPKPSTAAAAKKAVKAPSPTRRAHGEMTDKASHPQNNPRPPPQQQPSPPQTSAFDAIVTPASATVTQAAATAVTAAAAPQSSPPPLLSEAQEINHLERMEAEKSDTNKASPSSSIVAEDRLTSGTPAQSFEPEVTHTEEIDAPAVAPVDEELHAFASASSSLDHATPMQPPAATPIVEEPADDDDRASEHDEVQDSPLRALSRPRARPAVGVPGPGAYHVDVAYTWSSAAHAVRGAAMSKAARMPPIKSITPGPGAYNLVRDGMCAAGAETEGDAAKRKASPPATGEAAAVGGSEGGVEGSENTAAAADNTVTIAPNTIGKGVVFSSTGARQLQLQYGAAFVRNTTWAKRASALPGPGAYNIVDGDRIDQSRPLGTAKQGFQFAKSVDGAHFTGVTLLDEMVTMTKSPAPETDGVAAAATAVENGKGKATTAKVASAGPARLLVPWRDWAGGAYIGTATTAFFAHPSLAGGGRRTVPQPGDDDGTHTGDGHGEANALLPAERHRSTAAAAAAKDTSGGVWRGVGSGVALRLTSQRFPDKSVSPNPASSAAPAGGDASNDNAAANSADAESSEAAMARLRQSRGEPGPASYDTAAALKFIQKRAPEVSMTFKHDRGPRGPLKSTSAAVEDDADGDRKDGEMATKTAAAGELPGPASYNVSVSDVWGLRRSPQWSFGTAARLPRLSATFPFTTTTTVDSKTTRTTSAFTAAGATDLSAIFIDESDKEHGREAPGPGAYYTEAGYRLVRPSAASAVMGAAPRFPPLTADAGAEFLPEEDRKSGTTATTTRVYAETGSLYKANDSRIGPGTYDVDSAYDVLLSRVRGGVLPRAARRKEGGAPSASATADVDEALSLEGASGPGPGSYNLPSLAATGPTAHLGTTSPRFPWERMELERSRRMREGDFLIKDEGGMTFNALFGLTPGPGAYDVEAAALLANRPGTVIGRAPRGSFLVAHPASGSAGGLYSGGGSTSAEVGPGSYDLPSLPMGRAAVFSHLGGKDPLYLTDLATQEVPGPGLYDPVDPRTPAPRSFSLSRTSARFEDVTAASPAPTTAGATALFVRGSSAKDVPGPGAYDVRFEQLSAAQSGSGPLTFGTAARFADGGASISGGEGGHDPLNDYRSLVGPGSYDPYLGEGASTATFSFPRGPRFAAAQSTQKGQNTEGSTGDGVGPGAYEVVDLSPPGRSAVMGSAVARPAPVRGGDAGVNATTAAAADFVPGPGAYDPQYAQVERSVPQVVMAVAGAASRSGGRNEPGSLYENAREAGSGLGPGQYDPLYPAESAAYAHGHTIGLAPRSDVASGGDYHDSRHATPGPGAYEVRVTRDGQLLASGAGGGPGHHFGTAARPTGGAASHTGSSASPLLTAGAAATGGNSNDDVPGPGAYMPEVYTDMGSASRRTAAAAVTIGTAPRSLLTEEETRRRDVPGPGAYAPEVFTDMGTRAAAGIDKGAAGRIGTAPRTFVNDEEARAALGPGPGAYEPNVYAGVAAGPSVSFPRSGHSSSGGGLDRVTETPGPGAYAPENGDGLLQHANLGRAHYFGSAPRFEASSSSTPGQANPGDGISSATPGPNAYVPADTAVRAASPAHRFGTAAGHDTADSWAASREGVDGAPLMLVYGGKEVLPGPGAYDVERADRWLRQGSGGVGAAGASAGASFRFGTAARFDNSEVKLNDAAAADGVSDAGLARPYSGTTRDSSRSGVGPGSYDVAAGLARSSQMHTTATYSFPRASAHAEAHLQNGGSNGASAAALSEVPGPGAYSLEAAYRATLPRAAAVTFTSPANFNSGDPMRGDGSSGGSNGHELGRGKDDAPGPGAYQLPPAFPEGRQWGFGTAARHSDANNNNNNYSSTSPAGGVGGTGANVGPGSYAVPPPPPLHGGVSIPRDEKSLHDMYNSDSAAPTPGPGAYDVSAVYAAAGGVRIGTAPRYSTNDGYTTRNDNDNVNNRSSSAEARSSSGPGPGSYAPTIDGTSQDVRRAGPTFPHAPRMPSGQEASSAVGPGSYDVPSTLTPSATISTGAGAAAPRFGTAPRMAASPMEGAVHTQTGPDVGPGSYVLDRAESQVRPRAPAYTIGAARVDTGAHGGAAGAEAVAQPGPGSYDVPVDVQSHARAALMLGRTPDGADIAARQAATPGPGAYDVTAVEAGNSSSSRMAGAAAHRFGTAPTRRLPPPSSSSTHVGNGNGVEDDGLYGAASVGPGPGAYDAAAAFFATQTRGAAGGVTMAGRPADAELARRGMEPGPGAYDLTNGGQGIGGLGTSAPSYPFGTAPRMPSESVNGTSDAGQVGPGAYEVRAGGAAGPSVSFTQAPRMWNPSQKEAAGATATPGPGAYDVDKSLQRSGAGPSFTIPRGLRPALLAGDVDASAMVGPASYAPHDGSISAGASAASIGQAARVWHTGNVDTPGPGSYDVQGEAQKRLWLPAAVVGGPAPSFGTSLRPDPAAGAAETPGPGSYNVPASTAAAAASGVAGGSGGPSFGTAERPDVVLNTNPGPGTYEYISTAAGPATHRGSGVVGATFGSAVRPGPELPHHAATPGPGTYDTVSAPGALGYGAAGGPSFGSSVRPSAVLNDHPGPGSYDAAHGDFSPSSFKGRGDGLTATTTTTTFPLAERPSSILNDNPGPGTYQLDAAAATGFTTSFGYGERSGPVRNDNPGPGTYHAVSALPAGPAASFGVGQRPDPVLNTNPGPGSYSSFHAVPDGPAASFGYGERPSPIRNSNPGPGSYHREAYVAHLVDPPGARFGTSERPSGVLNANPGPGAYYREARSEANAPTFGVAERPTMVLNANPGPGTYFRGMDNFYGAASGNAGSGGGQGGVSFASAERPSPVLNQNPGPGTYYRAYSSSHVMGDAAAATSAGGSTNGFGRADRPNPARSDTPGPGTYYRGDAEANAATPTRGVTFATSERPSPTLNDNPGPGTYFRDTVLDVANATTSTKAAAAGMGVAGGQSNRSGSAKPLRRSKRPTAADTLRKLASVGYPLDAKAALD